MKAGVWISAQFAPVHPGQPTLERGSRNSVMRSSSGCDVAGNVKLSVSAATVTAGMSVVCVPVSMKSAEG